MGSPPNSVALTIPAAKVQQLEQIAQEYGLARVAHLGQFATALTLAEGLQKLDAALTPEVMQPLMALQGTRLGFLTDKDKDGGYPDKVVKRCVIEAVLRGVRPVFNEMNVIAGGFYATREAFVRLLRELPGLTELRIDMGVPRSGNNGAVVACKASWKLNNTQDSMEAEIPVRVNNGMGADAILGKAERKFRARIYNRITGSEFPEGEVGDVVEEKVVGAGSTGSGRSVGMPKPKAAAPEASTPAPAQARTQADLDRLAQTAEDSGVPPLQVEEAGYKLFGKAAAEMSDVEFETLLGWVKNGGEEPK